MRGIARLAALALIVAASSAQAQAEDVVVMVIDAGAMPVNSDSVGRAIAGAIDRPVVRMTDARAQRATGRLSIAFTTPDRWVLRYETEGQVGWVSDRIQPDALRARLAELTEGLVRQVEANPRARRRDAWSDHAIVALHDEILDPFAGEPRRPRARPVSMRWSEVIDPFGGGARRSRPAEVWSEVLDPWAAERRD